VNNVNKKVSSKAVYPGTFDPVTRGHLDIIQRARFLFPQLNIAVYEDATRPTYFSFTQRLDLVKKSLIDIGINNIEVVGFKNKLLIDYCKEEQVGVIVRGLRVVTDFEYEFQLDHMNQELEPSIQTVFLMTSNGFSYISSSMVKEVARLGGMIKSFVTPSVEKAFAKLT